jgi:hypothetical protein
MSRKGHASMSRNRMLLELFIENRELHIENRNKGAEIKRLRSEAAYNLGEHGPRGSEFKPEDFVAKLAETNEIRDDQARADKGFKEAFAEICDELTQASDEWDARIKAEGLSASEPIADFDTPRNYLELDDCR